MHGHIPVVCRFYAASQQNHCWSLHALLLTLM